MKEELYKLAGALRTDYQKKINNTYIWSSLARDAIIEASINNAFLEKEKVKVPTKKAGKTKNIIRRKADLVNILNTAGSADFNFSVHTYIVAQVEAFFSDLIKGVLGIDRRKLKIRVQGIEHTKKIDVDIILDSSSLEAVIEDIINRELVSIFYASPERQFEYLQNVIGVQVDERTEYLFCKWKEYKATRDLLVHNHGVINEIYLTKARDHARGNIGDNILVTKDYLDTVVAEVKSLIGRICTAIQKENKV